MEANEDDKKSESITVHIDLRPVDTLHAISAMRKYLEVFEQQMPIIQTCEIAALEAERPPGNDEEEQSIFCMELGYLEQLFEEELIPTMRYSFIVVLHTVLETRLRAFCVAMRRERNLPLDASEIRGSAIEQLRTYLTKVVGISVGRVHEWMHLRTFQAVRDCIVHSYGFMGFDDKRDKQIHDLVTQDIGVTITYGGRIAVDASFCERYLAYIETFFRKLFAEVGWK